MSKRNLRHWYTVEEMKSTLRLMNYCDDIANELASWIRIQLQSAFNRGFKNAMYERTGNYVLFDMYANPITHVSVVNKLKAQRDINAELLEALEAVRDEFANHKVSFEFMPMALNAIAKARGEANE